MNYQLDSNLTIKMYTTVKHTVHLRKQQQISHYVCITFLPADPPSHPCPKVSTVENYFSFRENENRSLQHLMVSKHRETWQRGVWEEKMGKSTMCSSVKSTLCTATLTHRMSVLCMGHCGGKMIFRIHKILADSPKFKE